MNDEELTAHILKHFHYDNGAITRDDRKGGTGSLDKNGYLILKVKARQFKAHRVAWLLNTGEWPKSELDHINRIRTDNRIENLRESNRIQQCENKTVYPNPDTGYPGIYLDKSTQGLKKKYAFHFGGKTYRFYTAKEAYEKKIELRRDRNGRKSENHLQQTG